MCSKWCKSYNSDVNDVVIDAEGNISHLTCNNKIIKSDLYIDCTGFKSLLLRRIKMSHLFLLKMNYLMIKQYL